MVFLRSQMTGHSAGFLLYLDLRVFDLICNFPDFFYISPFILHFLYLITVSTFICPAIGKLVLYFLNAIIVLFVLLMFMMTEFLLFFWYWKNTVPLLLSSILEQIKVYTLDKIIY